MGEVASLMPDDPGLVHTSAPYSHKHTVTPMHAHICANTLTHQCTALHTLSVGIKQQSSCTLYKGTVHCIYAQILVKRVECVSLLTASVKSV